MARIVHVITRLINGGADENTVLSCNYQAAHGHSVWLAHGRESAAEIRSRLDPRVQRVELGNLVRDISPRQDLLALLAMRRLFRSIRPDIVHTHESKAGVLGRLASRLSGHPVTVHGVHILAFVNQPTLKALFYRAVERGLASSAHAFVDVSEGMRDLCLRNRIGHPDNHFVVPSGMDLEPFRHAAPAADLLAHRSEWGDDAIIITYVAAFEPRKRHRALLEALQPALRADRRLVLVLVGDGPEHADITTLSRELGIDDRVLLTGFRADIPNILAASDIGLHVSSREGLPRTVVQCGLSGLPIVAMRLPGLEAIVRDGFNGHICPGDDFTCIIDTLVHLAASPDRRRAMAAASRTLDYAPWSSEAMGRALEHIYDTLLSTHGTT